MHRQYVKCTENFGGKIWREENKTEDLRIHGRIILKWMLGKQGGKVWTGFI